MIPLQSLAALALGAAMGFESWSYIMPHYDPTDTKILVNKVYRAPSVPLALTYPDVQPVEERYFVNTAMRPDAARALEALFAGAEENGLELYSLSGYRSYATQKAIFDRKRRERGEKEANRSSAKAGYSEHQTGLAMDFEGASLLGKGLTEAIGESPEGIWVAENSWRYGFILRYPKGKSNITGYIYEPWHVRYVGKEVAREVYELDVTYEEYMTMLRARRIRRMEEGDADVAADDWNRLLPADAADGSAG